VQGCGSAGTGDGVPGAALGGEGLLEFYQFWAKAQIRALQHCGDGANLKIGYVGSS